MGVKRSYFPLFQVEVMQSEVRDKEEENSALQREMSAARQKHEEATQALVSSDINYY